MQTKKLFPYNGIPNMNSYKTSIAVDDFASSIACNNILFLRKTH